MPTRTPFLDLLYRNRFLNHALFWIIIVLTLAYHGSLFGGTFHDNLINMAALLPVQLLAGYVLVYYQIPKLLFKRRIWQFLLSLIAVTYINAVLARILIIHIAEPIIGQDGLDESLWEIITDPIYLVKVYITIVYLPALILFLIKMTKERFLQEQHVETLEKERRLAELNFLKAQMNPHFLFNTLNNIYSLSISSSDQTPDMILKLSEILDYTIYDCNVERVPVNKEWALIENYADLEALRYSDKIDIVLDHDVDDGNVTVAPLILISLVENAFKFALKGDSSVPQIKISLQVKNKKLIFEVFNTVDKTRIEAISKKGIGVQNLKRQLELQYPNQHSLDIKEDKNIYSVILNIDL